MAKTLGPLEGELMKITNHGKFYDEFGDGWFVAFHGSSKWHVFAVRPFYWSFRAARSSENPTVIRLYVGPFEYEIFPSLKSV